MTSPDAAETARQLLLPDLERLCALVRETDPEQASFSERIRTGVERAREPDDLAEPFLELSTSAYRGFAFSAPVELLLDRVLEAAQTLATTLSASSDAEH